MLASERSVSRIGGRASKGCSARLSHQAKDETATSAGLCFTPGTAITTLRGKRPVEDLTQGDKILTRDRGFQPLLRSGRRDLSTGLLERNPDLKPVRIKAGSLGPHLPDRDLIVSPKHRLLTTDKTLLADVPNTEGLIEAHALLGRPGIETPRLTPLTFIHLLFEQHEVVLAENTWTESFHSGSCPLTPNAWCVPHS
jgi:hypothetical protein